jgi:hypothetical protein
VSGRTHLFVAPQSAPFGETVLGMRIADELHARGDEIVVFAHGSLEILVKNRPFRFVAVPQGARVDRAIADMGAEVAATSVVLLDATGVFMLLKNEGSDATFLRTVDRRVIGLDVWNLRKTGLEWDMIGAPFQHSRYSLDVHKRLIPVPFAQPSGTKGLYNALPHAPSITEDERARIRADFGVREGDRVLFFTTARWQDPGSQKHALGQQLALALPPFVAGLLARLGDHVHVVHVGPSRMPFDDALGDRYTWLPQRSPARFEKTLASADLLLSFNFSATTIATAIAAGIPIVLGVNTRAGALARFRVWPLGLFKFLEPLAKNNPYTSAMETLEIADDDAFVETTKKLLWGDDARAELRERQSRYRDEVAKLPSAADLFESYLS